MLSRLLRWYTLLYSTGFVLGLHAQSSPQDIPLQVGAGCEFSDYTTLPSSSSSQNETPSFRFLYDAGLGKGLYVVHFSRFNLPPDDTLSIRPKSADKSSPLTQVMTGANTTGSFYAAPILGDGLVIELYKKTNISSSASSASGDCTGFGVDGLRFTAASEAEATALGGEASIVALSSKPEGNSEDKKKEDKGADESLCGQDESQEAVCLETSTTATGVSMYQASRAVARLEISKDNGFNIAYCTGFLLGCEGHLITNQHCIRDWIDALNTAVEFFAEASHCSASETCQSRAACPGRVRIRSTALVAVSTTLDYALVKITPDDGSPIESLLSQVGYLQLRASGPKLDEEIYIPQYPLGWGKRIASTASGQPGRIASLSVDRCGGKDAGYYVDTQEGSSGSPVIATADNTVVALHHCGGCLNGAIQSQQLIEDLQVKGVLPRCSTI
ncbi:hypothetical protein Poli38472_000019 [Pythium oligandrum]|uniref:Serine protease n=1 Tax=Pythium oligandrum TaxID=41045 RepID=A0A8K1CB72_PYTOL|nr:hypothetical protein Poli38472_000019 [Pythium oligandrum]|eukprot:TMW59977.1 hypothetical protein Poli38472_000019 [Pythium oligandrum]